MVAKCSHALNVSKVSSHSFQFSSVVYAGYSAEAVKFLMRIRPWLHVK